MLGDDIMIALAGNKCDMEKGRHVDKEMALAYTASVGGSHHLTSAKSGAGVTEAFTELLKRALGVGRGGLLCRPLLDVSPSLNDAYSLTLLNHALQRSLHASAAKQPRQPKHPLGPNARGSSLSTMSPKGRRVGVVERVVFSQGR